MIESLKSVRLAAFRLVEAGLEHKPGIESTLSAFSFLLLMIGVASALLHVLQLASKAGSALSGIVDQSGYSYFRVLLIYIRKYRRRDL